MASLSPPGWGWKGALAGKCSNRRSSLNHFPGARSQADAVRNLPVSRSFRRAGTMGQAGILLVPPAVLAETRGMSKETSPPSPRSAFLPPKWAVITEGVLFEIIGVAAIVFPMLASIALEQLLGALCVLAGVFALGNNLMNRASQHRISGLFSGLVLVVLGVCMLLFVQESLKLLAIFVGVAFAVEGVLQMMSGFSRRKSLKLWPMLLLNGVVSLILSALIFFEWPESSHWIIGLLFGINLMFAGATLIAIGASMPGKKE